LLKKIPILGGKLWSAVQDWFSAGRELGALDEKRKKLEAQMVSGSSGISGADVMKARNYWIRVVRHLETTLDLDEAGEDIVQAILGPVRTAEKNAGRRAVSNKAEPTTTPAAGSQGTTG
jgi:hypothetical protein